jgi:hypothetical protein
VAWSEVCAGAVSVTMRWLHGTECSVAHETHVRYWNRCMGRFNTMSLGDNPCVNGVEQCCYKLNDT